MARGPGRPKIELTDEQVALIEKLASFGLTQAQIADCLPMSERTLARRLRDGEHEEILAVYERGRAKDHRTLSERHRDIALGRVADAKPSDQRKALEWRLERQHKWTEERDINLDGSLTVKTTHEIVESDADG